MTPSERHPPGLAGYLEARRQRIERLSARLGEILPLGDQARVLEFGCGHGHFLTAYAAAHPESTCVGIDLVSRRIEKGCQKRDKRELRNVHFLKAEATECLEAWPEWAPIGRVFLLFPDPWPKKRHVKNRMLQTGFLEELGRRCRPGALLHFRTDHPGNFEWGREVLTAAPDWTVAADEPWPFENPSYFQDLFTSYQSLTARFEPAT